MLRNFNFNVWPPNNPRAIIQLGLCVLLGANLVAAYFVIRPIGGSPQDLQRQAGEMRTEQRQKQGALDKTRALAGKIEVGRGEGDKFMSKYFLPRRTAYSTILTELNDMASQAKVTPRESTSAIEPVEGSDTLEMMQITANFEGDYTSLIRFVNLIDKSNRLLIMESLNATPQQGAAKLNVMMRLDMYVREDGSAQ
jgi:Tfp pilus assembly protein PilO